MEAILKYIQNKKVIGSGWHGSVYGESCLISLRAFYDQMTGLVDEGGAVDMIHPDFSQAFSTASHRILTDKLRKSRLEKRGTEVD